jgi:hypothetical protein
MSNQSGSSEVHDVSGGRKLFSTAAAVFQGGTVHLHADFETAASGDEAEAKTRAKMHKFYPDAPVFVVHMEIEIQMSGALRALGVTFGDGDEVQR